MGSRGKASIVELSQLILEFAKRHMDFPGGLAVKEFTCNPEATRDTGSVPGLGRSLGGGHDNPLQYSCLEKSHGQRSLQVAVHRVAKSQT